MYVLLTIAVSILVGSFGQLLLKQGMTQIGPIEIKNIAEVPSLAWRVISMPPVILGLACYGLGTLVWLDILSHLDLNLAYPLLALSYVLVPLLALVFLGEKMPMARWVGIGVIIFGVILVARTG